MPILFFLNENVFDFSIISILIRTTIEFPEQREEIRCRINLSRSNSIVWRKNQPFRNAQ